jgi:repressor LexA
MPRIPKNDIDGYLFIVDYFIQAGRAPSFQAIADKLGYGSKRSVQLLLRRLKASGRITYADGKVGLVHNPSLEGGERTVSVKIVGSAPCGGLSLAQENIEGEVDVSTTLAKPGYKYFILRAKGISMDRAGINDGDLVLVRQQATANDGDRVVALVDDEATIKIFHREDGYVILKPNSSNPTIKPIILSRNFVIQGVVVTTLPNPF